MKIFAKRKRKAPENEGVAAGQRQKFASDPVVEALLKKDPKEWNAKERRMIKRYQDRKQSSPSEENTFEEQPVNEVSQSLDEPTTKENEDNLPNETTNDPEPSRETPKPAEPTPESPLQDTRTSIDPDHKIWKLLDKLNSKVKRTLSRQLKREGIAALADVEKQARSHVGQEEQDVASKQSENVGGESPKKGKKRKVDWSSLTPEERTRREEQRRLQQEAAKRREEEGNNPSFKHPLNSERRRANRRKPKWNGKKTTSTNEHNKSGFMHRKTTLAIK